MGRAISRGFWQAYREQRALLVLCMTTVALPPVIREFTHWSIPLIMLITLSIPMLFILASSAMMLAGERETGTLNELRLMKPSRGGLLLGRILWLMCGTALFTVLLLVITSWLGPAPFLSAVPSWPVLLPFIAASWFEALAWGLLMSSRCQTVFRALSYSTVVVFLLGALFATNLPILESVSQQPAMVTSWTLGIRWVLALIVLGLGVHEFFRALRIQSRIKRTRVSISWMGLQRARLSLSRSFLALLWQQSRVQHWMWIPILAPLGLCLLFWPLLREFELSLIVFVATLIASSAMLGAFSTRYDLDDDRFLFFEQVGISMRRVWRIRILLTLFQWSFVVVAWLAMAQAVGIPALPDSLGPFGTHFHAPGYVQFVITLTTIVGGMLTLLVSQLLALHAHRPILTWFGASITGLVFVPVCLLWCCSQDRVSLWLTGVAICAAIMGWQVIGAKKLLSLRPKWMEGISSVVFAGLIPVGMCTLQYANWLSAGPEPTDFVELPDVMTRDEIRSRKAHGEEFARPEFAALEQRFLDVLEMEAQARKDRNSSRADVYEEISETSKERIKSAIVSTQRESLSSTEVMRLEDELRLAEQTARWAYANIGGQSEIASLCESLCRDETRFQTAEERRQFCQGFYELARFCERYDIGTDREMVTRIACQSLWDWCSEADRSRDEVAEVLQFLLDHDIESHAYSHWTAGILNEYRAHIDGSFASDASKFVTSLPGYHERYENFLKWEFQKRFDYQRGVLGYAVQAPRYYGRMSNDESFSSPVETVKGWTISQYGAGFLSVGGNSAKLLQDTKGLEQHALRQQEYGVTVLRVAILLYRLDHERAWPALLDDLVDDGILKLLPLDPYTGYTFVYRGLSPWSSDFTSLAKTKSLNPREWAPSREEPQILWSPGPALKNSGKEDDWRYVFEPFLDNSDKGIRFFSEDLLARGSHYRPRRYGSPSPTYTDLTEDRALDLGTIWELDGTKRFPDLNTVMP